MAGSPPGGPDFPKMKIVVLISTALLALCPLRAIGQVSLFETAHENQKRGNTAAAEKEYRAYLKADPHSVPAITNLGVVLAQQGKFTEAIAQYRTALSLDPQSLPARIDLALAYYRSKRWREASETLEQVLRINPQNRRCRQLLAISYVHRGDPRRAAEEYEKLMPTDDPEVLVGLASSYKDLGRKADSDRILSALLQAHEDSPTVSYLIGMAAYSRGDYPEAVHSLQQSLRLDPSVVDAHFYLGATYFKLRNLPAALAEWKLAQDLDSNSFPAFFASGALLIDQQSASDARPFLERAYALKPNDPAVQLALGEAYFDLKQPQKALPLLQSASRLMPHSQPASFLLARTLKELGLNKEAAVEFARCKTLFRKDLDIMGEPTDFLNQE